MKKIKKIEQQLLYPELEDFTEVEKKVESLKRASAVMLKTMEQTYAVSDEMNARCKDIMKQRKQRRLLPSAPANTLIDLHEQKAEHFASGVNFYKLLLVCFIGSFAGVVVELLWCLLRHGYLESRSGLVYGPFNLLYGAGAVALTGCLYKFRNNGAWISIVNAAVSLVAVGRWSERVQGLAPSNALEELLDERFPDERMERIYANMEW